MSENCIIIGSCNGLSPIRRQAITWTNDDLLSIGPLDTNVDEIRFFFFLRLLLKMFRDVGRFVRAKSALLHYSDVTMNVIVSQITGVSIVCSTVCSGADHRKHQSSVSLAFVRGIHRRPVDSLHNRPVTRKMFSFADVIMGADVLPNKHPKFASAVMRRLAINWVNFRDKYMHHLASVWIIEMMDNG